ncbi:hypothetical protein HC928_20025 [bacterium]|nr:hypothetical protein [bacterium]
MMKRVFSIVLAMGLFWFASIADAAAARSIFAQISYDGVFDCFDASLSQPPGW